MYHWINGSPHKGETSPVAPVGEPTPLLSHLAGEFAPRVAGLWRAPHAAFLTAAAERRHLVCLALALAGEWRIDDADALLHENLKDALRSVIETPPPGLRRALTRLGETAWTARDYHALLSVLTSAHSSKAVRHAKTINVELVRALAMLPPPLLRARVTALGLTVAQATLLVECLQLIRRNQGEAAAEAAAQSWAGAENTWQLFLLVREDIYPDPPPSPLPTSVWFKILATKAEIRDAAQRYNNCLRGKIRDAASGESVFLEWAGTPGAIIELWRDPIFGWRLCEARLAGNAQIEKPQREEIVRELRRMGVLVGRTQWSLNDDLATAAASDFKLTSEEEQVGYLFGD